MTPIWIFVLCIAIFVIVLLGRGSAKGKGRSTLMRPFRWPIEEPPAALGVPVGHPVRSAAERLETALGLDLESRVKDRVLKEAPDMSDEEWNWTWFELKRYFLMCAVMKGVTMYSGKVDAVWHEMLMFTREYEEFCSKLCGMMIHHAPHGPSDAPEQDERAWFDWVYGELFTQAPASGRLWGNFYRTKMPESRLKPLAELEAAELREKWFNAKAISHYADLGETADYLIHRAKSQLQGAGRGTASVPAWQGGYDPMLSGTGLLAGLLIMNSIGTSSDSEFSRQMDMGQTEEQRQANDSGAFVPPVCGSGSDPSGSDHSGGDGGGSDGGSSCGGGGCSSS
ncbi:hypothetical protein [Paenibacillus radicis (ex Gao et al. 2016)]|uniref:Uncharacterized protein n=1 Tax=Paenibacillus radicis (ex Gao et al. 2016) TaxID=1737354 RepID=A0A917M8W5_9BACL|nr:hypothetical protein [Paenibacillus radicis (ex Gao et al. 2016)]GGG85083.1 hypothetical protein GCM10010918_48770 [Paenibacillus radicis (ex Gao et al. 2016)]